MSAPAQEVAASYQPITIGPSWKRGDDGKFSLPELTLGWHVLGWTAEWLQSPEGGPWQYTPEQARLTLWWYAIDADGRFRWRDGVIQRLKGWGKDPLAATWAAVEFVGPCRFGGWRDNGEPKVIQHPSPWVQIAAVSREQTRNTMTLFPQLFTRKALDRYSISLGKEIIYGLQGRARIEAVTSSPRSLEGGRPTFQVLGETHHWLANNEGHAMSAVISRNAAKSRDGSSRTIAITNAYEPSEDSVAQRTREAWEEASANGWNTGLFYDSLEAPPEASLNPEDAPSVVNAVRGDAEWLDVDRIVASILDRRNSPSQSRRFWYNQITAAEEAWVDPADWNLCRADDTVPPLAPGDEITLFLDCAKSDDATALMAARVRDGLVVTLGMWQRPPGKRGDGWLAPRGAVDLAVEDAFSQHTVAAFYVDPSHAKDDETNERYWDGLCDDWHRRYQQRLKVWASPGKHAGHAVIFDMSSHQRHGQFVTAAERVAQEIEEHQLIHDGDGRLRNHVRNARRFPTKWGVSLMKDHRESARKIDLAVAMVGALMARRSYLNNPDRARARTGRVWV